LLKNDAVTGLLASLVELENRRVDLALRRTERNADLAAVDARIVDIERQLRAMAESYESGLALEIRALDGTLAQMRQRLATIPGEQVRYARLQRRASGIEDVYKMLTTRLKEAEVAEAVKLPNVRIVDAASLPYQASSPNVPLNLALGLIFGLMLGLTLALLREYWDSRLHERSEVEHVVGLPILAMIPSLRRPGPVVQVSMSGVGRSGAVLPPKREHRSARAELETQISLEAFRALAVDLKFAGEELGNRGLQTVAVTSSARGEGKTLTSCNLALTRASHGVRTLLIDADMRASGVSGFFGMNTPTYGLSDLLAGSAQMPAVCANLRVDGRHTLAVIPAGMPTPHSAELLDSPTMRQLLEEAKTQYELIVIDTPPLNAITDAATIDGWSVWCSTTRDCRRDTSAATATRMRQRLKRIDESRALADPPPVVPHTYTGAPALQSMDEGMEPGSCCRFRCGCVGRATRTGRRDSAGLLAGASAQR
jgi:capsular exopolysaccharide synthesis family protein